MSAVRNYYLGSLLAASALFVIPVTTQTAHSDDVLRANTGVELVRWTRPYYRPYYGRPYYYSRPYYSSRPYYYGRPYYYARPYYARPYYQPYYRPYSGVYRQYYWY
jgi:hypothetical protein